MWRQLPFWWYIEFILDSLFQNVQVACLLNAVLLGNSVVQPQWESKQACPVAFLALTSMVIYWEILRGAASVLQTTGSYPGVTLLSSHITVHGSSWYSHSWKKMYFHIRSLYSCQRWRSLAGHQGLLIMIPLLRTAAGMGVGDSHTLYWQCRNWKTAVAVPAKTARGFRPNIACIFAIASVRRTLFMPADLLFTNSGTFHTLWSVERILQYF